MSVQAIPVSRTTGYVYAGTEADAMDYICLYLEENPNTPKVKWNVKLLNKIQRERLLAANVSQSVVNTVRDIIPEDIRHVSNIVLCEVHPGKAFIYRNRYGMSFTYLSTKK